MTARQQQDEAVAAFEAKTTRQDWNMVRSYAKPMTGLVDSMIVLHIIINKSTDLSWESVRPTFQNDRKFVDQLKAGDVSQEKFTEEQIKFLNDYLNKYDANELEKSDVVAAATCRYLGSVKSLINGLQ